ncbi:MAG: FAD-dependent oxidoreductase [Cyanobacteria bacterium J06638_22]
MVRRRKSVRGRWRKGMRLALLAVLGVGLGAATGMIVWMGNPARSPDAPQVSSAESDAVEVVEAIAPNGRPQLSPLPEPEEIWTCDVAVIGGSLGGVAAAAHAMQAGATTCLIELTPWLGGQISSQGVSAIDESLAMRRLENYSPTWANFKRLIAEQPIELPNWVTQPDLNIVADVNSCWVGKLCFPPKAGAIASQALLETAAQPAPKSRWGTAIAFKGATFDESGQEITAIHAVRRTARNPDYAPVGRFSRELAQWYSWSADDTFTKTPLRLEPPPDQRMIVIDATDTGELVGWAGLPHRLGSESRATTQEVHAGDFDNPDCTQSFTYPFVIALHNDGGASLAILRQVEPDYSREEHRSRFDISGIPLLTGRSFFNYRRIVSTTRNDPFAATPAPGDMAAVNWNPGNDWSWMNPPLIFTDEELDASGQRQNWMGGLSAIALRHGEDHALLFAEWLLENHATPDFPFAYLAGANSPMGTESGLSMVPYIREGRRILAQSAYGQDEFMMLEPDVRKDLPGGRDFRSTKVTFTHYPVDLHGCKYRNGEPTGEASSAPTLEANIRPIEIPLESLIPQGVDNVLIGGKGFAVSHIVNAATRIHYGEWNVGAAAGAIAAYLTQPNTPNTPAEVVSSDSMPALQTYLTEQGLRLDW